MATLERSQPGLSHSGVRVGTGLFVYYLYVIFVLFEVLAGVLRWVLGLVSLYPVIYIPKLLVLFAIPIMIGIKQSISPTFTIVSAIFAVSVVWGLLDLGSAAQALFGLWVFVPLIFSVLAANELAGTDGKFLNFFRAMFWICCVGVIANYFIAFPWAGATAEFGGQTITAARDWQYQGVSRFGGFASSSISAAAQAMIFLVYLTVFSKSKFEILMIWLVGAVAILITTTKGIIFSYVVIGFYFGTSFLISRYARNLAKPHRIIWSGILLLFVVIMVVLPLMSISSYISLSFHSAWELFLLDSFSLRLSTVWPASLALLHGDWHWYVGRGMGGIGAAQQFFEVALDEPGDNLFVYLTVTFGIILTLAVLALVTGLVSKHFISGRANPLIFPLTLSIAIYGMFVNIVEEPLASTIVGICLGATVTERKRLRRRDPEK